MLTIIVVGCLWVAGAVLHVALSSQCERCGSHPCKCAIA